MMITSKSNSAICSGPTHLLHEPQAHGHHLGVLLVVEAELRAEAEHRLRGDRLGLGVAVDPLAALATTHAGLAHAAHRGVDAGEGGTEGLVDVDRAALDLARDDPAALEVAGVDRGVQAVLTVVGPGDRVGLAVEPVEADHRA